MNDLMTFVSLLFSGNLAWHSPEWLWAMGLPLLLWLFKKRGKTQQQQAYADAHLWAWVRADSTGLKMDSALANADQPGRWVRISQAMWQLIKKLGYGTRAWLVSPSKVLTIGWICLVIALAGPRSMVVSGDIQSREGVDILISMDLSHSMTAEDVYPNRFLFAKSLLESMVSGLELGDRLALQGFAGQPHMVSPLSYDRGLFRHSLGLLEPNLLPLQGTWLDLAIVDGLTHLTQTAGSAKVMIIFTNGAPEFWKAVDAPQRVQNSPFYTARTLSDTGVKIIIVGIGQRSATTLKDVEHRSGKLHVHGLLVKSRLEENRLQKLAQSVGGVYLRAEPGQDFITRLLSELTLQAASRTESQSHAVWQSYAQPFLVLGVLALLLAFYLLTPLTAVMTHLRGRHEG